MRLTSLLLLLSTRTTIITEIEGDSMIGDGLYDGDIIFAKKKKKYKPGEIVICKVEGHDIPFVKRLVLLDNTRIALRSSNLQYEDYITEQSKVKILGSVRFRITFIRITEHV